MQRLEELEGRAEEFESELELEYYLAFAGLKDSAEFSKIYERYTDLFAEDTARSLVAELRRTGDRRLRNLAGFVASCYIERRVTELTDKYVTEEIRAKVLVDGREEPLRRARVIAAKEPNRSKRSCIYSEIARVVETRLNPILEERVRLMHAAAEELGLGYLQLYAAVNGVDYDELASMAREFLDKTGDLYYGVMDLLLKKYVGVSLEEAERHDIAYLFVGAPAVRVRVEMVDFLKLVLSRMGINLDLISNVKLDTEPRPRKTPRAFVAAIRVPSDIRLVVYPAGSIDDFRALFHEAGHALHFAFTDPQLPPSLRRFGPGSITETYAFLMEHVLLYPQISEELVDSGASEYLLHGYADYLHLVRRYCAKLLYELKLRQAKEPGECRELYAEVMTKAMGYKYDSTFYLSDVDDGVYAGEYLRAWFAEAMLRSWLEKKHGKWYASPEAGRDLRAMWSRGFSLDVEELVAEAGYPRLAVDPLVEQVSLALGSATRA